MNKNWNRTLIPNDSSIAICTYVLIWITEKMFLFFSSLSLVTQSPIGALSSRVPVCRLPVLVPEPALNVKNITKRLRYLTDTITITILNKHERTYAV